MSDKHSSHRGQLSPAEKAGGSVPEIDPKELDFDFTPPPIEQLNEEIPNYDIKHLFFADCRRVLYRAYQSQLDRDVAIKVLPPFPLADNDAYLEEFVHEARTMARLSHPNIIRVHDFGTTASGLPYFVMEYVSGAILDLLIQNGQITLEHVFAWIPQLCEGLNYAHQQSVIHGDVRPINVLLSSKGEVKMANFGLSSLRGQRPVTSSETGTKLAARDYIAPEARGRHPIVDHRSDIYSLGVLLYEMLTGEIPRGAFKKASQLAAVDPRFDIIIEGAMAQQPEDRIQSSAEIRDRILEIADDG